MRRLLVLLLLSSSVALGGCAGNVCPPAGPQPPGCGDTPLPGVTVPTFPAPGGAVPTPVPGREPEGNARTITKYLPSEVPIVGRFAFHDIEDLPLSITIMGFGEHIPSGPSTHDWFRREQAKGAQHWSGVSIWNNDDWVTPEDLPPALDGAYVTGFDGEPLRIQDRLYLDFLQPAMRDHLAGQMREHIDAGTDGFVFDEVSGTADAVLMGQGPFGATSLAAFRKHLAGNYDASELAQMGIADVDTFDYREFLLANGHRERYAQDYWARDGAPLRHEYYAALRDATQEGIRELIADARAYAQARGKTLVFTANADPIARTELFRFYDDLDVYVFEHEWFPRWRDEQGSAAQAGIPDVPSMKYARSLGTWAAAMPGINEMDRFADVTTGTRFFTHEMAETYAAGGYYMYFPEVDYIGISFTSNRSMMYPYYEFVRENPTAFLGLETPAQVAVAKPFHAFDREGSAIDGAKGFSLALYQANVPHDLILVEDVTSKYDVVVTAGSAFTDEEVETLLDFAAQGGTVIATDRAFASRDESDREVSRPALEALKTPGVHTVGSGRFVYFQEDLPYKVWGPRDPAAIQTILDAVAIAPSQAPANVTILPYTTADGGRLVLHVLNYEFDGRDFSHRSDLPLSVRLPPGVLAEGKTLTARSPDRESATPIPFEVADGRLSFTLPSLYVWDVLTLE